ncbi:MAG: Adaptive-response sensory-kinase SasA [Planctomycetes bacterium]|nr:Adaptive-response sensory-kinase SasA [Planctomycetota bacterium]
MACAVALSAVFAASGLLYGWLGGEAVAGLVESESAAGMENRRRAQFLEAAPHCKTEAVLPLLGARGAADRVASEARRFRARLGAHAPSAPSSGRPAIRTDAESDVYWCALSGGAADEAFLAELAAAMAPALRVGVAPADGAARVALRIPGLGEIGAPARFADACAASPEGMRRFEDALRATAEQAQFGWATGDAGPPGFTAGVDIGRHRGASVWAEASPSSLSEALDAASRAVPSARALLLSATGRVLAAAPGTGELVAAGGDSAERSFERIIGAGPAFSIGSGGFSRELGGLRIAVHPVPATGYAVALVAPKETPAAAHSGAAAAARGLGWGVAVLSAVFGAAVFVALRRSTRDYERRSGDLVAAASAHGRGNYDRSAEVPADARPDDELAILALWLNAASARIRGAQSRTDEADRRFTSLIQSMADGFVMTDAEDRITFVNDRFAALLGHDANALAGRFVEELVLPDSLQRYRAELAKRGELHASRFELAWATRGGGKVRTIVSSVPTMNENGRCSGSYAVVTDITDRVRAQDELARAEKLRALGEMAGGIAHDFNNVLTVVLGNSQYLLTEPLPEEALEVLRAIENAALDGTETVRRLREFTRIRNVSVASESVDPVAALSGALEDIHAARAAEWGDRGLRYDVSRTCRSRRRIRGNAAELREALRNVIENAVEAMPEGGRLSVDVFDRGEDAVAIRIEDTGSGIPEENLPKIFDPFFTTKDVRRCAGLGLSITYGIIRAHRGRIDVKSSPGGGTTVTVVLPAGVPSADDVPTVQPAVEPRVLLAGPAAAAKDLQASLRALGINVVTVDTAQGAAELLHDRGIFNVLVAEHEWNGQAGWDLARLARRRRDDLRILLIADPHQPVSDSQARNAGIDRLLFRPFDARDLHAEVFAMMAAAPNRVTVASKPHKRGATTVRTSGAAQEETTQEIWGAGRAEAASVPYAPQTDEVEVTVVAPAEPAPDSDEAPVEETFAAAPTPSAEEDRT